MYQRAWLDGIHMVDLERGDCGGGGGGHYEHANVGSSGNVVCQHVCIHCDME